MKKLRYTKELTGAIITDSIVRIRHPKTGDITFLSAKYEPDKLICTLYLYDNYRKEFETFTGTSVRNIRKMIIDRFKAMGVNFEGEGYL